MSRIAGWSAQVIEQWADNRLIRPMDNYVGPMDLKFVPIDQR
jgi:citrate synthase